MQESLLNDRQEWADFANKKSGHARKGVVQRAEALARKNKGKTDTDYIQLHIAWTLTPLLVVTKSTARAQALQLGLPELAVLAGWDFPHGAGALRLRSKLGFSQTLHRRAETINGRPRTLLIKEKRIRLQRQCSFLKVSDGKITVNGAEVDKVEYLQVRLVFTVHQHEGSDEVLGTAILGRWAKRVPKVHSVIPGVQTLEWESVPRAGTRQKPAVPGSDAFYALVDGQAVIESCVVFPWFKTMCPDRQSTWKLDEAKELVVCAERLADSNKN
jgi:hypothetical protein